MVKCVGQYESRSARGIAI